MPIVLRIKGYKVRFYEADLDEPPHVHVVKAGMEVTSSADEPTLLPVIIPDLDEVRAFGRLLHNAAQVWEGEYLGWPSEYTPEARRRPVDSKMRFTPAEFWIGVSGVWFFSMMWESGSDGPPVEFLDSRGLVKAIAPDAA